MQHLIPSHPHMFFLWYVYKIYYMCIYIYIYIDIHTVDVWYVNLYIWYIHVSIYSSKFLAFLLNPEVKQQAEDHSASGLRNWRSRGAWVAPRASIPECLSLFLRAWHHTCFPSVCAPRADFRYGLPPDPVIFTKQLLRNRQNSTIARLRLQWLLPFVESVVMLKSQVRHSETIPDFQQEIV